MELIQVWKEVSIGGHDSVEIGERVQRCMFVKGGVSPSRGEGNWLCIFHLGSNTLQILPFAAFVLSGKARKKLSSPPSSTLLIEDGTSPVSERDVLKKQENAQTLDERFTTWQLINVDAIRYPAFVPEYETLVEEDIRFLRISRYALPHPRPLTLFRSIFTTIFPEEILSARPNVALV